MLELQRTVSYNCNISQHQRDLSISNNFHKNYAELNEQKCWKWSKQTNNHNLHEKDGNAILRLLFTECMQCRLKRNKKSVGVTSLYRVFRSVIQDGPESHCVILQESQLVHGVRVWTCGQWSVPDGWLSTPHCASGTECAPSSGTASRTVETHRETEAPAHAVYHTCTAI